MVSLRGRELKLLALRGVFAIDSQPVKEVVLRAGMRFQPARGLHVEVEEVVLPDAVMALEGQGLARQVLSGANSLYTRPRPMVDSRYRLDAEAWIHSVGKGWRLTVSGQKARPLQVGESFEVSGVRFSTTALPLDRAASPSTMSEDRLLQPLVIVARFDTAHIRQGGELKLALDGIGARIVSELVAFDGPVAWYVIAGEIWKDQDNRTLLRRRWDIALARLRRKFRGAHVRANLVRSGGKGMVELMLNDGDRIDDQT